MHITTYEQKIWKKFLRYKETILIVQNHETIVVKIRKIKKYSYVSMNVYFLY